MTSPSYRKQLELAQEGQETAVIYTRYSNDSQKKASTEDQSLNCREAAERKGWVILENGFFSDEEKSGTTIAGRTALAALMAKAKSTPRPFDYIVIDDTSRLGRNMSEVFRMVDILTFRGIYLYFVSNGLDSQNESFRDFFVMAARSDESYSKQLGMKVSRGRRGRFLAGFNPGGGCYGYRNIPSKTRRERAV